MNFEQELAFLSKLIGCHSVTNEDDGKAIDALITALEPAGFTCHKLVYSDDKHTAYNLYAEYGNGERNFCFSGHTDIVDPGELNLWHQDPFTTHTKNGIIYGRGMVDMKGAIACFIAATLNFIKMHRDADYKISFLISGDEETTSKNGMIKMLEWLKQNNKNINACLVGEPTNPTIIGESVKVGRRGSVNFTLTVKGQQGHAAYPKLADNAITKIVAILHHLKSLTLDHGTKLFEPSNLEITNITVNNQTTNIIPGIATANFNIRYNDAHTSESLIELIESTILSVTKDYELESDISADVFFTDNQILRDVTGDAIKKITGLTTSFNTAGGTSDARFIHKFCPVVEFGLINKTAHKVNECCHENDIKTLTAIYEQILVNYFGN